MLRISSAFVNLKIAVKHNSTIKHLLALLKYFIVMDWDIELLGSLGASGGSKQGQFGETNPKCLWHLVKRRRPFLVPIEVERETKKHSKLNSSLHGFELLTLRVGLLPSLLSNSVNNAIVSQ